MENENKMGDNNPMTSDMGSSIAGDNEERNLPKGLIILGGIVVIAIVVVLIFFVGGGDSDDENGEDGTGTEETTGTDETNTGSGVALEPEERVIEITDDGGYNLPATNTFAVGSLLVFNNDSSRAVNPAARNEAYPGLDFVLEAGDVRQFSLDQLGQFELYDKLDSSVSMNITVVESSS